MSNRATRLALVLGTSALLALTACSSGGSGTTSSAGATPSPTATSTGGPSSSTSPSGQTFRGNGVSFQHPQNWQEFTLGGTTASTGNQKWNETVGIDDVNFVSVSGYAIKVAITSENIDQQKAGIARQIASLFAQAGGALQSGPTDETMAGLPALGFVGTAKNPSGRTVSSRLVLAFDGTDEYFVNCQYDSNGQSRILAGCDLIAGTFTVG